MALSCYLCKRKRQKGNITLHQFPKNICVRKAWATFCKLNTERDNLNNLRLCSSHFTNNDFKTSEAEGKKRYLKHDAMPSIYIFSKRRGGEEVLF
ncbi:hypothetical protein ABEB36_005409 [Hypothenemus hampei]|uniref:THAP-type domain-containing protein n=1 Tax=Hypothenemus hampei TaxID=57062 RepID=A0ABD1EYQ5_HYPHA